MDQDLRNDFRENKARLEQLASTPPEQFGFKDYSGLYRSRHGNITFLKLNKIVPAGPNSWKAAIENPTADDVHVLYHLLRYDRDKKDFLHVSSNEWFHNDIKLEALLGHTYEKL